MPQHIPKEYIKDNSHISWIQDQERNNPNIHRYTEMMYYDYSYYMDMERRAIPIALILYSEEVGKFIYYWNLRETCPRNSFPVYILVHMQESYDYKFIGRFGLIRLGKLGSNLDSKKCIPLRVMQNGDGGGMVRRDDIYYEGRPVISIHDSSNSDCLLLFFCDCYQIVTLTIDLCQEDVENTFIHAEFNDNPIISNYIPHRYDSDPSYESTMISPNIYTNGGCQTNILHHTGYMYHVGLTSTLCLFQYENGVQKIIENIDIKDNVSGNSVSLVNQSTDEIFIMNYGGRKHGFYKVTPSRTMDGSRISPQIEKVSFENYAQFKPFDNERHAIIPCHLTPTKYLILITDIQWQRTSYQRVFTKSTWLLVDLNETRVKVVYPRVYDLANLTKQSDDDFVTVKKKIRGGRSGKIGQFQDGDLNGGYSDPALLSAIKPSNIHSSDLKDFTDGSSSCQNSEVISDQKPISLIPFPEKYNLSDAKLISFRPFAENPELFQVHLFCPEFVETLNYLLPTIKKVDSYGQSFRFYFKFRDEATCKYSRLLTLSKDGQFSDISIRNH